MKISITSENIIKNTLLNMDCARNKDFIDFIALVLTEDEMINKRPDNNYLKEAEIVFAQLCRQKLIKSVVYAGEKIVVLDDDSNILFERLNAFACFVMLCVEIVSEGGHLRDIHAGLSNYPYDAVVSTNKYFYRIISFNEGAIGKINFHNSTFNDRDNKTNFVLVLVVDDKYSLDRFENLQINGKFQLALIKKNKKCRLSEVYNQ